MSMIFVAKRDAVEYGGNRNPIVVTAHARSYQPRPNEVALRDLFVERYCGSLRKPGESVEITYDQNGYKQIERVLEQHLKEAVATQVNHLCQDLTRLGISNPRQKLRQVLLMA